MQGAPLVQCRRHPADGPIWHRADRPCPVCRAQEEAERLKKQLEELVMRK
jgi:hypothetical protein